MPSGWLTAMNAVLSCSTSSDESIAAEFFAR